MEINDKLERSYILEGPEHLSLKVQNVEFDINVP